MSTRRSATASLAATLAIAAPGVVFAALLEFQIPEKVVMEKENDFYGVVTISPVSDSIATALGLGLTAALKGATSGSAITSVRLVPDKTGAYDKADLREVQKLASALKGVRLKKVIDGDNKIFVSVRGKDIFTAGDIAKHTNAYEITNPDHVLLRTHKNTQFDIELTVGKGRGYNTAPPGGASDPLRFPVEGRFSPVEETSFRVEPFTTDKGVLAAQLVVTILTDGTASPEQALEEARSVLAEQSRGIARPAIGKPVLQGRN